jgi:hypothetical protein
LASLERTEISNRWGPPMPSIMCVSKEMVDSPPGSMVVEPTTGSNGQQPSSILTWTSSILRVLSPTFLRSKDSETIVLNGTCPRSIDSTGK